MHSEHKSHPESGSLDVVGSGIQLVGQMTLAAQACIEAADKVLFAVADPATAHWIRSLNSSADALPYDRTQRRRRRAYAGIVERILQELRRGRHVCAVFYGHPGVLTDAAHIAIERARQEGHTARMLPGISAEACLFADLGIDPGHAGCQSFEATDFLIRRRIFDPRSVLILWQLAMLGNLGFFGEGDSPSNVRVLVEVLEPHYTANHEVVVYEAAVYPVCKPMTARLPLSELPHASLSEVATLYVPPIAPAAVDVEMVRRLGMESS